jgi:hypothetical protein
VPHVKEAWNKTREWLLPSVSAFAKRLAPGLAVAEDPGEKVSFGHYASRRVADVLTDESLLDLVSAGAQMEHMARRLLETGLNPHTPHLLPGSADVYDPFE